MPIFPIYQCNAVSIGISTDVADMHIVHTVSPLLIHIFHCAIKLHLKNLSAKIKLLRISRWCEQNLKPSEPGPCVTAQMAHI